VRITSAKPVSVFLTFFLYFRTFSVRKCEEILRFYCVIFMAGGGPSGYTCALWTLFHTLVVSSEAGREPDEV